MLRCLATFPHLILTEAEETKSSDIWFFKSNHYYPQLANVFTFSEFKPNIASLLLQAVKRQAHKDHSIARERQTSPNVNVFLSVI